MKRYKVLTKRAVFAIGKQEYSLKQGDVIELDENHITTIALVERKSIEVTTEELTEEERLRAEQEAAAEEERLKAEQDKQGPPKTTTKPKK